MMELDDLKAKWKAETDNYLQQNKKDMEQLQLILKGKTADMITLMQKKYQKIISIMLAGMLLLVFILPVLTDGFTYPGSINGFAKAMFFYLILIVFYWEKLKSVTNLELSDEIKERMVQLLKMLKRNSKIEIAFVVIFFTGFILTGRFFYGHGLDGIFKPEVLIGFVVALLFTGWIIYLINKRYQHQINELQEYLAEYDNA